MIYEEILNEFSIIHKHFNYFCAHQTLWIYLQHILIFVATNIINLRYIYKIFYIRT